MLNANVSPIRPNTLNVTQKSVVCVRQTISLTTAMARKNRPNFRVSLRQPVSSIGQAEPITADQRLDDRRLQLDEGIVVQGQGQPAEHADDAGGDQGHQGDALVDREGDGERDGRRRHQRRGGDKQVPAHIGGEKHHDGSVIGKRLYPGLFIGAGRCVAIRRFRSFDFI